MRALLKSLVPLLSLGIFVAACGGGYGDDEATNRCAIDEANYVGCFDDAAMTACLDCYAECGDECQVAESCPVQYVCAQE
jgi:hypothetical protein